MWKVASGCTISWLTAFSLDPDPPIGLDLIDSYMNILKYSKDKLSMFIDSLF